jgi:uncharacterized protein (TIGR02594 family)
MMVTEALKLYGTIEVPGTADNPVILSWAKEIGVEETYSDDAIPWCGLFMGVVAQRALKPVPSKPLWALNWRNFGHVVDRPMLGDVMVMSRNGGGHVTLYVFETDNYYYGIGGNQDDAVNIAGFAKTRPMYFRRPNYRNQPDNVRVIKVNAAGLPTTPAKEA